MDEITKEAIIRDLQLYVGNEIRLARLARRMSQRELAQRTGLTSVAICRVENAYGQDVVAERRRRADRRVTKTVRFKAKC